MTERQKRFCDEYLIDLNGTRAYKAAYPSVKKDVVAATNAGRLLRNAEVKHYYIDEKLEEMHNEKTADAQEVMEYLTAVMRRQKKEQIVVTLTNEESTYKPDASGTMRKHTVKTEYPKIVEIDSKLCDANKAAELLGKRYSLFTDKMDVSGIGPVIIYGEDDIPE